ncbi:MAG TPA: hypothetical protein VFZ34_16520 [Blastocatellia bacterium]|nr:hypothetical protein [Blastocatellia bacterium]
MKRSVFYLLFSLLLTLTLSWAIYGQDAQQSPPTQEQEVATPEHRGEDARPKPCSVRTLNVAYGWLGKGTVLNMPNLPSGPMAILGRAEYDGAGNFKTTFTGNYNGLIITQTETGTYIINHDCTGTISFRFGDAPTVITNDGREIRSLQAYPVGAMLPPNTGWVLDAIGRRIAPEPRDDSWRERIRAARFTCNPHNVAGTYVVQASGTVLNAPPFPSGPALGLSRIELNAAGQSSVKGTFNFNGLVMPIFDTATGTGLNPDCTSTAKQTGNGAIQKSVFVNGGTEFFFLQLPPEGVPGMQGIGAVFFGEGKRIQAAERIGVRW